MLVPVCTAPPTINVLQRAKAALSRLRDGGGVRIRVREVMSLLLWRVRDRDKITERAEVAKSS